MQCRSCQTQTIKFLSLGDMPLVNLFLSSKQLDSEKKYELTLAYCPKCHLVQLAKNVSPEILFKDYIYFSSVSKTILEHAQNTASTFIKRFKLDNNSLVFEIASNDGYLLQYFQEKGIQVLGIDPAENIAEVANKKGIKTIPDFFCRGKASELKKLGIKPDVIFGANVLAHVPAIDDFAHGIFELLPKKGIAVFEFPYAGGLFEGKFDTIYHEHVFYYTLMAVKNVFSRADLKVFDCEIIPMQGGSLRIFICHIGVIEETPRLKKLLESEYTQGFDKLESYEKLGKKIAGIKMKLLSILDQIKKKGQSIAAYSAPAKGLILLNYFGITINYLDFIVDKAKEKQGLYTPGNHLMVYPVEKVLEDMPDYLLILCWNIAEEVMEQMGKYSTKGGKFIIPIPKPTII